MDEEPYEEDQDSDQYPEDEVVENMNDAPAEDADVTPASSDEDAGNASYSEPEQGDDASADTSTAAGQPYGAEAAAQSEDVYGSRSAGNGSYYASHDMSELTGSHTSAPSDEPRRTSAGPDIPEFMMKRNTAAHRHTRAQDFKDDLAVHDSGEERREREAKNAAIDAAVREARGSGHTVDVSGKASGGRRRKKKHRR